VRPATSSAGGAASAALSPGTGDAAAPPALDVAGLTEREVAVLRLLTEGCSNRDIAARLHISPHTAANHVRSILMKTQCANRTEAAAWALRRLPPTEGPGPQGAAALGAKSVGRS